VPGYRNTGDDWPPEAKLAVVIEASFGEDPDSAAGRTGYVDVSRPPKALHH